MAKRVKDQSPKDPYVDQMDKETKRTGTLHITEEDPLTRLQRHYLWWVQDMDTRRVRKNGWNDIINAYMGKIPINWPYNAMVTIPLIRTTILEKTSRLLNAKLQGRVIPREGASELSAKIQNALLDLQWDLADEGGSMLEKISITDQRCRIFGGACVLNYWDVVKNSNEIKVLDPRDVGFDGAATHIKNAKWVQVREFTTFDKLEQRGYDVGSARDMAASGEITAELRSTRYESIVKANRSLVDRTGMIDDLKNPVVEVVTEYGYDKDQKPYMQLFLPKYGMLLCDDPLPYKHGKIPVSMLRYYPLDDDIIGESEVESVLSIQRAVWALVCGFIDECNIKIRPPLKIASQGVRIETIEYGPGAQWIMNSPNNVVELEPNGGFIQAFSAVFPMLVSQFQAAMGDQSEFNQSQPTNSNDQPTATQVVAEEKQQNVRDQYNQLQLAEFLKDIMLMWIANNKQYIFDDPSKKFDKLKLTSNDSIREFQQMGLDQGQVPDSAMQQIQQLIKQYPDSIQPDELQKVMDHVTIPSKAVAENPEADVEDLILHKKLEIKSHNEADLYITPKDMDGLHDYIPDVKSMATGAGIQQQNVIQNVINLALNPEVSQLLQTQGQQINIKDVLVKSFEQAGLPDAESLFQAINNGQQQQQPGMGQQPNQGQLPPGQGPGGIPGQGAGGLPPGVNANQGFQGLPQAIPSQFGAGGVSQPIQLPNQ